MLDPSRPITLLGPQPNYASLKVALEQQAIDGPVALITAGWETDEQEDGELKQAIGVESINLNLFARTEQLFADDPELIQWLRDRQDELRHLRDAYNGRLNHLLRAAREIIRRKEVLVDLESERESAIEMVRQLDRQYFVRTSQIVDRYEEQLQTAHRPQVIQHRQEIGEILNGVNAILISGGHVAIILNRLRIFGILEMNPCLPIVAWSGGAMALSDQIVFFHDSPPQGKGNPEVLRAGMGVFQDLLPLPDARARLRLKDRTRVKLFARRFGRYRCVILDEQTILRREHGSWVSINEPAGSKQASCLGRSGRVERFTS